MLQHAVLVEVFHVEGLGEVLTQEMGGAGLQGLAVSHHGFDGVSDVGAGEFFGFGFCSGNYRNCGFVHGKVGVDVEHLRGFIDGFLARGVRGVAFLRTTLFHWFINTGKSR